MSEAFKVQLNTRNMDSSFVLEKSEIYEDVTKWPFTGKNILPEKLNNSLAAENLRSKTGNDFLQYLTWLQMENEPDLMALPSMHHYYYEINDLKNIKILVNLKPLNNIKQLESFLQTLGSLLPHESSFIGYFKNTDQNKSVFSLPLFSNFFQGFINYVDLKTDNTLTKREVSQLLEEHNLNVIDITDINGMTYFCAQTA
jgi:hypothetical protein